MRQTTHPVNADLAAWLDALAPGTWLRVPVHARWTPLGITRATIDGTDLEIALSDTAMGIPLLDHLRQAGGRLLVEGTWGPLLPLLSMPGLPAPPRALAVRRVCRPLAAGDEAVVSAIKEQ